MDKYSKQGGVYTTNLLYACHNGAKVFIKSQLHFTKKKILHQKTKVIYPKYAKHWPYTVHMCLVGPLNPYKLLQSWELTFLIGLTPLNTKLAKKKFFTDIL